MNLVEEKVVNGFKVTVSQKGKKSISGTVRKPATKGNYTNGRPGTGRRRTFLGVPKDNSRDLNPGTRLQQVENSRGLAHNSGLIAQISSDYQIYAVGDNGFRPRIETADEQFNKDAVEYFEDFALRASSCGRYNLTEICAQIAGMLPIDGEVFAVKTRVFGEPAIQLLETHNIATLTDPEKNIVDGIERSRIFKRPIAYHINTANGETKRIKASAVCHIHRPYRPSSVRFAPHIQHSINDVIDEQEIIGSENNLVKFNQRVGMTLTSDEPGKLETDLPYQSDGTVDDDGDATTAADVAKAFNVHALQLKKGESLKEYESKRPSQTFLGLLDHLQRDATLGVLPFEWVANPKGVAGAAMRLIVGKANRIFRGISRVLVNRFLRAVWFFVIGDAIDRGLLPPVKGWHRVKWTLPKQLTVDFGRDEAQNRANIGGGLKTYDEDYEERGLNADEEFDTRAKRIRKLFKLQGHEDWETRVIPMTMLIKPDGVSLSAEFEALLKKGEDDE